MLARAEVFAAHNPILPSLGDGLGTGLGFGLALFIIAIPRILLGTGKFIVFGQKLFSLPILSDNPIGIFVLPPGAFLTIGLLHALFRRMGVERHE